MNPGDLVRFVRKKVSDLYNQKQKVYLRTDVVGIVIKKVNLVDDMWIVNFPKMGGHDGYPEAWLEVISEVKKG